MSPKKQLGLSFINKCGCIVDYELLEKAMLWYADGCTLKKNRVISIHAKYPAISIYYQKIHVHRILAMYKYKSKIAFEIHAHHKDGNKLNADINNIELISASNHLSHHNKGKVLTDLHKQRISEANRKRKGIIMKRKYEIPTHELQDFLNRKVSINEMARHYKCDWSTIKMRVTELKNLLN